MNFHIFLRWSNITFKSITKRNTEIPEETVAENETRNEETKKPISNGFQKPAQNKVQGIEYTGRKVIQKLSFPIFSLINWYF